MYCKAWQCMHTIEIWHSALWDTWWRHGMDTFSALPALCEGIPPVRGAFFKKPIKQSFGFSLLLVQTICWSSVFFVVSQNICGVNSGLADEFRWHHVMLLFCRFDLCAQHHVSSHKGCIHVMTPQSCTLNGKLTIFLTLLSNMFYNQHILTLVMIVSEHITAHRLLQMYPRCYSIRKMLFIMCLFCKVFIMF